jgi:predicted MPP superfamily phosphohydrolase
MSALAVGRAVVPLLLIAGTLWLAAGFLRRGFPEAWHRWLRRVVVVAAGTAGAGFTTWAVVRAVWPGAPLAGWAMTLTATIFASGLAVSLTSAVWGPLAVLSRGAPVDDRRRAFLRRMGGALPAAAATAGPLGAAAASVAPVLRRVEIRSAAVDDALDGFTILHITDLHLGVFIGPAQVAAVVDAVRAAGVVPDLVALTGDIADDYAQLPEALSLLKGLGARHGVVASIGNHEIYRGRDRAAALYAEAGVPLLCSHGTLLSHAQGAALWVAGADDPGRGVDGDDGFLAATVDRAFAACPAEVRCRILLSHRPRGFVAAQRHRTTLTLSGHTHGAQMALAGRSLLQGVLPGSFLLGQYTAAADDGVACHLYTSAGLGHWMPFRLNCPCEAGLVTLRRVV